MVAADAHDGSSVALYPEVDDDVHARAVEHGATSQRSPADQPHGTRLATIVDPYDVRWMLAQVIGNPTLEEMKAAGGLTLTAHSDDA